MILCLIDGWKKGKSFQLYLETKNTLFTSYSIPGSVLQGGEGTCDPAPDRGVSQGAFSEFFGFPFFWGEAAKSE